MAPVSARCNPVNTLPVRDRETGLWLNPVGMRVLAIVHQADAGPGVFADAVAARGHRLDRWQIADGRPSPARPETYDAVLTFGGSPNPDQVDAHPWLAEEARFLTASLERQVPLLGVCLGAELLAMAAGGSARRAARPEIGWYPVSTTPEARCDPLFAHLPCSFAALEWHSYGFSLPPGAVHLAFSEIGLQAYRVRDRAWGIQFHAEATLETFGSWLADYRSDPDAVAMEGQLQGLLVETRSAIREWNRLGYELCDRFLQFAESDGGGVSRGPRG